MLLSGEGKSTLFWNARQEVCRQVFQLRGPVAAEQELQRSDCQDCLMMQAMGVASAQDTDESPKPKALKVKIPTDPSNWKVP